jgi:4-amino-4-deoxy-L-arabinose transferase-like glycosyltransferase
MPGPQAGWERRHLACAPRMRSRVISGQTVIKRLVFLALLAFPFFVVLDTSSVWDANEAFYVQTPREMLERGDWVVPYFNGQPRLNKPPLSYWLVGGFYRLFGVSLFWERLILAVLGFGSVLLVCRAGKLLFDSESAMLAAGIFATTFRLLMLSRRLLIDILLLFCLLALLVFFLDWLKRDRKSSLLLAAVFLGLGFLAKGPVALIAPALLYLFMIGSGQRRRLKARQLAVPALVFAAIASSWFLMLLLKLGPEPIISFFLKENLGRFANVDYGPARGWLYYPGVFLGDFFPWSLFFVVALVGWVVQLRHGTEGAPANRTEADSLLLYWCFGYLLVFSLSYNKQEYYILPAYPAAALWLAYHVRRHSPPRWLFWGLAVVIPAVTVSIYLFAAHILRPGLLWLPLLAGPFIAVSLILRRVDLTAAGLAVFYGLAFVCYLPPFEAYKPIPAFAEKIKEETNQLAAEGEEVEAGYYNFTAPSLVFYLNKPVFESYSLADAVARVRSSKMVLIIVGAQDYEPLCTASGLALQIVDSRPKIYTTARFLAEGLKSDGYQIDRSTHAVYLVTNKDLRNSPVVSRHPGLQ